MTESPLVPLGKVLTHRKEFIQIDDSQRYKRCRVQLHAQGIVVRDEVPGVEIKTKAQQVCRGLEFLVAEIDAKVGGFGIVPPGLDGAIVSSHYFLFSVDPSLLDVQFLGYYIRTAAFRDQVTAQGSTNYAAIRPSHVLAYTVPLPSLEEQRRIVVRIEGLFFKLREAESLQSRSRLGAEALTASLLVAEFERMAQSWPNPTFGEFCRVVRGGSPRPAGSPVYYDGPIPFLKVADLTKDDSMYVTSWEATIKEAGLSNTRQVAANTLMLTNSGATLGVPKICPFETTFNDGIQAFLDVPEDISLAYLYLFLKSKTRWFREWAARGQGQPNLNTEMVKRLPVPLPPLQAQEQLVSRLSGRLRGAEELQSRFAAVEREMGALRPSILSVAFGGSLL